MTTKLRFALFALLFALAACGGDDTTETDEDAGTSGDAANVSTADAGDVGGGDSGPGTDANTCDDDPPSVSTNPVSPIDVAFDAGTLTIRLDFDEPVNGVQPEAFTIDNGATVDAVGGMDDAYDVTINGLQASTTYSLNLAPDAVRDLCDNNLDEPLEIIIEVGADPCDTDSTAPTFTVQPTPPIEVMTGTTSTTVTLLFSEPIEGVAPTANNGATIGSVDNPQGNDWNVEVTGLVDGRTTITVPATTADLCGNTLAAAQTFDIIVGASDSSPPMVISSTPNNGESGVALDSDITFEFSEPMDTSVGTISLTSNGSDITFTSAWSNNDRTLTIDPTADFANGDGIVAVLSGFADPAGNALPNEVLAFTALPDPCVFDTTPPAFSTTPTSPIRLAPGTTGTTFIINFSEPVVGVTAAALSVNTSATVTSVTSSANNYSVTVSNLAVGNNIVTIPGTISDVCGNTLGANRTVSIFSPSTDQTPPTVVSTVPADGATNIARNADIVVTWSEPMDPARGAPTLRVGGVSVARGISWDSPSVLRLDPVADFPFGATVDLIMSNFADVNGNTAALDRIGFAVEPDPCAVYPSAVTVESTDQDGILADVSGEAWVLVELSDLFQLTEGQISITPVTGTGVLAAGSLTGINDKYAFRMTGTSPGDEYTISIGASTSNGGCTTLASSSFTLTIPPSISVGGSTSACPLPPAAASNFTGGDACNSISTNDSFATPTQTGLTLDAIGDVISFGGVYDSDQSAADVDFFSFEVVEDGTNSKDLLIEFYQGCNFTAAPTSSTTADFEVALRNSVGATIDAIEVTTPRPREAYDQNVAGVARMTRTVDGLAGTNTYILDIDEQVGGSWCADWRAFVEVVASGRPAACEHQPAVVSIENVPQLAFTNEFTQDATIDIALSSSFGSLTAQDITVLPLGNARGSLKPGSLTSVGGGYTAELGGVQAGETYLVTLNTGATGCTIVEGSGFYVTITDDPLQAGPSGVCPLPAPLAQNHFGADACNQQTNGTLATSESTGITVANVGDRFSIQGTLDNDFISGSDDDWYSFQINENGTNIYSLDVTLIYGCDFADDVGTNDALTVNIVDDSGNVLGTAAGTQEASTAGDRWESVSLSTQVANPAGGLQTYHLEVDDQNGFGLCMDFIAYVEVTDISGSAQCLGRTATANLASANQTNTEAGGTTSVRIDFDSGYTLTTADLSLTAVTGTGTLDLTSFQQIDASSYTVDLTGVAVGDEYTIDVAGGTDACSTSTTGGSFTVNVQNLPTTSGSCPLPPTLPNHFARTESCGSSDTNYTVTAAANTGFTVANVGDSFSISSTYDTSGSPGDNDWFSFQIDNSTNSTFTFDMRIAYGCTITGGTASGSDRPVIELRSGSTGNTSSRATGSSSYSTINSGTTFGYGDSTPVITPPSGTSTYYIWMDDVVASSFCFDYVIYLTVTDKT